MTLIVKVWLVPVQPTPPFVKVGVIIIVAINGVEPVFIALKLGIEPMPFPAKPIVVLEFVQV